MGIHSPSVNGPTQTLLYDKYVHECINLAYTLLIRFLIHHDKPTDGTVVSMFVWYALCNYHYHVTIILHQAAKSLLGSSKLQYPKVGIVIMIIIKILRLLTSSTHLTP